MRFTRSRVLENTGVQFNARQLSAISNVLKYMTDRYYDKSNLKFDIDIVKQCYDINPYLLTTFDDVFIEFLNKKAEEVEKFNKILLKPNNNYFLQELFQYAYLPLRYSKDPIMDAKILVTFCGLTEDFYHTIIFALTDPKYRNSREYVDKIHGFIAYEGISYEEFGKSPRVGWFEKYPQLDSEIIDQFDIVREEYNKNKKILNNKAIGNYAELECANFLKNTLGPHEEIVWVSRNIGDGFGYDIMIYNKLTNESKIYEVKGSLSLNKENMIELTKTETIALEIANRKNVEHHSIKFFFNEGITRIYDVCNINGNISLNQTNGRMMGYINKDYNYQERKLTYRLL